MDIMEIIADSLLYPFENLKALMTYVILGFILGIVIAITGVGTISGIDKSSYITLIIALIGLFISILISFLINGYGLDIIKLGITRSNASPEIDLQRQVINGVKSFILSIVYYIVPIIIMLVLSLIFKKWILYIVGFILLVLFSLAATMGQCRLAKTEDLSYSLNISSAIDDIFNIGLIKVLLTIIIIMIVLIVITVIFNFIFNIIFNQIIASAILGIIEVYLTFFSNRAMGLLYSEI